jgi:hypothetical protein
VLLAIFGNLVRSLYLSLTANAKGIVFVEKVHDSAGWSIMVFTAIGVALGAWLLSKLEKWLLAEQGKLEAKHAASEHPQIG